MTARLPRTTTLTCPDCGWVSKPTTPRTAAHALGRHSCDTHRARAARAARVAARQAANGPRRDCTHPNTNHEHGTRAAYVLDRCRCRPCRTAARHYQNTRSRAAAYGHPPAYTDATPARDHVRVLMAAGIGWKRIAHAAGIHNGVMSRILYGDHGRSPSRRIRRSTAHAILSVTADTTAPLVLDGTGTARRLQALAAAGWPQAELARRLNLTTAHLGLIIHGRRRTHTRTAEKIRALYDELWNSPPPDHDPRARAAASRSRNLAAAHGWAPALAWDDDAIDDPAATPVTALDTSDDDIDEVAVWRRINGDPGVQLSCAERFEVITRLHAAGMNDRQIARRTGIHDRQVIRDRKTLGLPAVTDRTPPRKATA